MILDFAITWANTFSPDVGSHSHPTSTRYTLRRNDNEALKIQDLFQIRVTASPAVKT